MEELTVRYIKSATTVIPAPGPSVQIPGTGLDLEPRSDANTGLLANFETDSSVEPLLEELRELEHRMMRFSGEFFTFWTFFCSVSFPLLLPFLISFNLASTSITSKVLERLVPEGLSRFLGETYTDLLAGREFSAENLLSVLCDAKQRLQVIPDDPTATRLFNSGFIDANSKSWFNSYLYTTQHISEL